MIQPEDEINGSEDIINLDDVKARINYMVEHDCHGELEGFDGCDSVYACPSCYGDAEQELAHLRDLADEMKDFGENASAIRGSYLKTFVQSEADGITGINQGSYLFGYINWKELAIDRTIDMSETTYRGSTYFITS